MKRFLIGSIVLSVVIIGLLFLWDRPALSMLDAADTGDLPALQRLLKSGATVDERDTNGFTPLMYAVAGSNNINVVKCLLDNGADVNVVAQYGDTPLHVASFYGNLEIMDLLIDRGANVNAKDKYSRTPRKQALSSGQSKAADLLIQRGARE